MEIERASDSQNNFYKVDQVGRLRLPDLRHYKTALITRVGYWHILEE